MSHMKCAENDDFNVKIFSLLSFSWNDFCILPSQIFPNDQFRCFYWIWHVSSCWRSYKIIPNVLFTAHKSSGWSGCSSDRLCPHMEDFIIAQTDYQTDYNPSFIQLWKQIKNQYFRLHFEIRIIFNLFGISCEAQSV